MTTPYTSIFDGPTIITQKDLCEILNLDTSRPGLKFSPAEIQKAYRQRALRFHPDAQKKQNPPIPTEVCNILMNDIVLARDYMLQGEDNILGKAFVENSKKSFTTDPNDWIDTLISVMNGIQSGTSAISSTVPWISRFSNNFLMILLLSTFSNGQLNFRYVNIFSKELNAIRPYLKDIDGTSLANFLRQLKDALNTTDQMDVATIVGQLKEILPEDFTKHKKFDELIVAMQGAGKELKEMLTDDFINHLQHIVRFWPNFIATVPSWRHIVGIYFTSLLLTSSSLPKYFNASKTVAEVIWEQKGTAALILSSLPMLVLTAALLPLNIAIQFGIQCAWIALKASIQLLLNGIKLLYSAINVVRSQFNEDVSLTQNAFMLFESTLNLTVRLAFNIAIEMLDEMIFILSNQSMLSSIQSTFNSWLDSMIDSVRPKGIEQQQLVLITVKQDKAEKPVESQKSSQNFAFFDNGFAPLHNAEDDWLKQLLANLSVHNDEVHDEPLKKASM